MVGKDEFTVSEKERTQAGVLREHMDVLSLPLLARWLCVIQFPDQSIHVSTT